MTHELELYPFEQAEMYLTAATIIPPIFCVTVIGKTGSLNPIINLVNEGKIVGGYLELLVVGRDGEAIGQAKYSKSIDVSQVKGTRGIVVKGANNKEVKLDWEENFHLSTKSATGLFHLKLQSDGGGLGAPVLNLNLTVDTINKKVSGYAVITQSLANPVVCTSHVTGVVIYESVMQPDVSKIRIDLSGYPEIHWPPHGGIGPITLQNFQAMILLDANWSKGIVEYQYLAFGIWKKENQRVSLV